MRQLRGEHDAAVLAAKCTWVERATGDQRRRPLETLLRDQYRRPSFRAKNISWNWYSGGWNDAVAGHPDPLFQFHHQPLNYFQNYAPGMPGRTHLQDETAFVAAAQAGTLPAVSFVKPIGEENEHPGYASTDNGDSHLVELLKSILDGPDGKRR